MNRILALQVIEPIGMDLVGEAPENYEPSTCSVSGCSGCSSYSNTGCGPITELMVAVF
jgi:predicted secreted protein